MKSQEENINTKAKPFVKWVGGKRQLLPIITQKLPLQIKRYIEPFIGGGALYWEIERAESYIINDYNSELINVYEMVQKNHKKLIKQLSKLQKQFYDLGSNEEQEQLYYQIRAQDQLIDFKTRYSNIERAARFIFLNKTSFNGLYRVNRAGYMNTPFGHPTKTGSHPIICDTQTIIACNQKLSQTTIVMGDYQALIPAATEGDFWFLDPPYLPLLEEPVGEGTRKDFSAYTAGGFTHEQHKQLARDLHTINDAGAKFILTNHNAPSAHKLYKDFNIEVVSARRAVSAKTSSRAAVANEIIVSNF